MTLQRTTMWIVALALLATLVSPNGALWTLPFKSVLVVLERFWFLWRLMKKRECFVVWKAVLKSLFDKHCRAFGVSSRTPNLRCSRLPANDRFFFFFRFRCVCCCCCELDANSFACWRFLLFVCVCSCFGAVRWFAVLLRSCETSRDAAHPLSWSEPQRSWMQAARFVFCFVLSLLCPFECFFNYFLLVLFPPILLF